MGYALLRRASGLEKQMDSFIDTVSEAGLVFQRGLNSYIDSDMAEFENKLKEITEYEKAGANLRRLIMENLFTKTLIPESRGDVAELLANMDKLLNKFKGAMWRFDIEQPEIDSDFHGDFKELIAACREAVESLNLSVRAFFKNISAVGDHLHKVHYWESECDKIAARLQRSIFRKEGMRLSHRMMLKDLSKHLDRMADVAEDVADQLNIYVIKRSL